MTKPSLFTSSVLMALFIPLTMIFAANQLVSALDCPSGQISNGDSCVTSISVAPLPHVSTDSSEIALILDILFAIIGAIALLIITIAGFRYIVSRGESKEIAGAKNAILYAVIGLVLAILAFTIVNFVVGSL